MTKSSKSKFTMKNLIYNVLKNAETPLRRYEIWEKAPDEYKAKYKSSKTPERTLSSVLTSIELRDNVGSIKIYDENMHEEMHAIASYGKQPSYWYLPERISLAQVIDYVNSIDTNAEKEAENNNTEEEKKHNRQLEIALYPFLVKFAYENLNHARLLKIDDKTTAKGLSGQKKWIHPDLVGFSFPLDMNSSILKIQRHMGYNPIVFYSFEMKQKLDFRTLREYYSQTITNSSWANKGYLVVGKIVEKSYDEFLKELKRLSLVHGIGVIELGVDEHSIKKVKSIEPKIIVDAKFNEDLDWEMMDLQYSDDLSNKSGNSSNVGFKNFIDDIDSYIESKINGNKINGNNNDEDGCLKGFISVPESLDEAIKEYRDELNKSDGNKI